MNKRWVSLLLVAVVFLAGCAKESLPFSSSASAAPESASSTLGFEGPKSASYGQDASNRISSSPSEPVVSKNSDNTACYEIVEEKEAYTTYQFTQPIGITKVGTSVSFPDNPDTCTFLVTLPNQLSLGVSNTTTGINDSDGEIGRVGWCMTIEGGMSFEEALQTVYPQAGGSIIYENSSYVSQAGQDIFYIHEQMWGVSPLYLFSYYVLLDDDVAVVISFMERNYEDAEIDLYKNIVATIEKVYQT